MRTGRKGGSPIRRCWKRHSPTTSTKTKMGRANRDAASEGHYTRDAYDNAPSREFTLAHRRWFDLTLGLKCLAKRRAMPWPDEPTGATYQTLGDEAFAVLTRSGFRLAHPH